MANRYHTDQSARSANSRRRSLQRVDASRGTGVFTNFLGSEDEDADDGNDEENG